MDSRSLGNRVKTRTNRSGSRSGGYDGVELVGMSKRSGGGGVGDGRHGVVGTSAPMRAALSPSSHAPPLIGSALPAAATRNLGQRNVRGGRRRANTAALLQALNQDAKKENLAMVEMSRSLDATKREKTCLRIEWTMAFLAILGVAFALIEYEVVFDYRHEFVDSVPPTTPFVSATLLRSLTSVSTIALVYLTWRLYEENPHHVARRRPREAGETLFAAARRMAGSVQMSALWDLPLWFRYVEMGLYTVHLPPGFYYFFDVRQLGFRTSYRAQTFVIVMMLTRAFILLRLLRDVTACTMRAAVPTLSSKGVSLSTRFVIKRLMEKYSLLLSSTLLIIIILMAALIVRLGELGVVDDPSVCPPPALNCESFTEAIWMIVATISTVGFGDVFPLTHLGRVVCCTVLILGIALMSLLTATLIETVDFTFVEKIAMNNVSKLKLNAQTRNAAALLIFAWWRAKKHRSGRTLFLRIAEQKWKRVDRHHTRHRFEDQVMQQSMSYLLKRVAQVREEEWERAIETHTLSHSLAHIHNSACERINEMEMQIDVLAEEVEILSKFLHTASMRLQNDVDAVTQRLEFFGMCDERAMAAFEAQEAAELARSVSGSSVQTGAGSGSVSFMSPKSTLVGMVKPLRRHHATVSRIAIVSRAEVQGSGWREARAPPPPLPDSLSRSSGGTDDCAPPLSLSASAVAVAIDNPVDVERNDGHDGDAVNEDRMITPLVAFGNKSNGNNAIGAGAGAGACAGAGAGAGAGTEVVDVHDHHPDDRGESYSSSSLGSACPPPPDDDPPWDQMGLLHEDYILASDDDSDAPSPPSP